MLEGPRHFRLSGNLLADDLTRKFLFFLVSVCVCLLTGRKRGCMVLPDKLPQLEEALMKLVRANLGSHLLGKKMEEQDWRHVTQLLFKAKRLFFSPEELKSVGFDDVLQFDLSPRQCLFARGVCWFINQAPHTISLTTIILDEDWLKVRHGGEEISVCPHVRTSAGF